MKLKNIVKITLIAMVIGLILTIAGCSINKGFSFDSTVDTNIINISSIESENEKLDKFVNIDIESEVSNIKIIPSDEYKIELKYIKDESIVNYEVKDNTLKIKQENLKKVNNNMDLLKDEYNLIKIYVPKGFVMENINIVSNVGNISLDEINSNILSASCDVGNIEIKDTNINKKLNISNDVGNIEVSGKIYGESNIKNNIGNIDIEVDEYKNLYNYKIKNELGILELDGKNYKKEVNADNKSENNLIINCETGRIELNFK